MQIVFATNNKNKLYEVSKLLTSGFKLLSLNDINCTDDLPETQPTLEGNALQKARYVYEKYKYNCFADDTGLEIDALGGKPGVFSARFAGEAKSADDNMRKVLEEMKGIQNRAAKFRTVIALILDGKEHLFEGEAAGRILEEKRGEKGFGYDPIFAPYTHVEKGESPSPEGEGFRDRSFAEMTTEEKNKVSHRALAVQKLTEFLNVANMVNRK